MVLSKDLLAYGSTPHPVNGAPPGGLKLVRSVHFKLPDFHWHTSHILKEGIRIDTGGKRI